MQKKFIRMDKHTCIPLVVALLQNTTAFGVCVTGTVTSMLVGLLPGQLCSPDLSSSLAVGKFSCIYIQD